MLSLPVVAIANLTSPAELFRCVFYKTTLSAGSCIARQGVRRTFRGGTAQGKQYKKEFVPKIYEYCASGKCMQGADVRVALPDHKPPATEAERTKVRNRALGAQNLKSIEEKLASAEPPVAADLERAAKVEAENKSWRQFQEEKERRRAAEEAAAPAKPEPEPHPLSRRGLTESNEEESVEQKRCKEERCTLSLRADNESGYCKTHGRKYQARAYRERLAKERNGAPAANDPPPRRKILGRRARAAQRAAIQPVQGKVFPGLLQAQPDDLLVLLEQRRAHHLAEAERCDRALKALRA